MRTTKRLRDALRSSHVAGWKPGMTVQIEVRVLEALLDDVEELDGRLDRMVRLSDLREQFELGQVAPSEYARLVRELSP